MVELLEAAQRLDAAFVNWWNVRDLDQLFERIGGEGPYSQPMWKLACDRGLRDETGAARPGLEVWDAWLAVPRTPPAGDSNEGR